MALELSVAAPPDRIRQISWTAPSRSGRLAATTSQSPQSSRRELTVEATIVTAVIGAAGTVLAAWVAARV
jgi:hypothetical protein